MALQVSLPEGLHVQSNAPRDPSLIPTVLTIDAPAGVTVDEIVYPPSTDLKQVGQDQPLAVFEREFVVGVHLTLAPGLPAGDISVPLHLRYQACDAQVCYPPATADAQWSLTDCRHRRASRRGPLPRGVRPHRVRRRPCARLPSSLVQPPATPRAAGGHGVADLDRFTVLATVGGYLGSDEFLRFIHNAESGVKERGMFEGRGPLAILLIVFLGGWR